MRWDQGGERILLIASNSFIFSRGIGQQLNKRLTSPHRLQIRGYAPSIVLQREEQREDLYEGDFRSCWSVSLRNREDVGTCATGIHDRLSR